VGPFGIFTRQEKFSIVRFTQRYTFVFSQRRLIRQIVEEPQFSGNRREAVTGANVF
jgi:hypothetical protein